MDKALMQLKDVLEKEIMTIAEKKDISPTELERLDKAVDIIKDIETICAMKEYSYEEEDWGYSQSRPMYMRDGGNSYRRGRNSSNGQYMSRDGGYSGYYPMYYDPHPSYPGAWGGSGVSYAANTDYMSKPELRENLRRMMAGASSDKERMAIQQLLDNWKE